MKWPAGSIQQMIDAGEHVSLHHAALNPTCTHNVDLDLEQLREQFGPGFVISANRDAFLARFRCSECGRKGSMSVTIRPRSHSWRRE